MLFLYFLLNWDEKLDLDFLTMFQNQKHPGNDATNNILKPILLTSENIDRKYSVKRPNCYCVHYWTLIITTKLDKLKESCIQLQWL